VLEAALSPGAAAAAAAPGGVGGAWLNNTRKVSGRAKLGAGLNSKAACGGGSGGGVAKEGGDSGDNDGVSGTAAPGFEGDGAFSEAFAGADGESAPELDKLSVPADASASNALFCFMMIWYSSREIVPSARLRFAFSSASATPSPVEVETRNKEEEGPCAASEVGEGRLLVAVGSALVVEGAVGGRGARAAAAPEASFAGTKCAAQVS